MTAPQTDRTLHTHEVTAAVAQSKLRSERPQHEPLPIPTTLCILSLPLPTHALPPLISSRCRRRHRSTHRALAAGLLRRLPRRDRRRPPVPFAQGRGAPLLRRKEVWSMPPVENENSKTHKLTPFIPFLGIPRPRRMGINTTST